MSGFVGVVCGVDREARLLRKLGAGGWRAAMSGASAERALARASRLAGDGAAALLSFGLAAGLDPNLRAGDLVLADNVLYGERRWAADPRWRAAVLESANTAGIALKCGDAAGSDKVLSTPADKQALRQATGAAIADMESQAVAMMAEQAGLPFLVLRAVSDPADSRVPPAATAAVGTTGEISAVRGALAASIRPWDWPALLRLGRDGALALDALSGALPDLRGALLGIVDG